MKKEYVIYKILDYSVDGENIWFITTEFPAYFFQYDFNENSIKRKIKFPDGVQEYKLQFRYLRKVGKEIYFFSEEINQIYVWNMDRDEFQIINIKNDRNDLLKGGKIYPIVSETYIYCINMMALILIQIEKQGKRSRIIDLSMGCITQKEAAYKAYYTFLPCLHQHKILIPVRDRILSYDEERGEIEVFADPKIPMKRLDDDFTDYLCGVISFNDRVIIYTYCGDIFEVEGTACKRIDIDGQEESVKKDGYYRPVFQDITVFEQDIFFWISFSGCAYRYKMVQGHGELIKLNLGEEIWINGSTINTMLDHYNIIISWETESIFRYDITNGYIEKYQIALDMNTISFSKILHEMASLGNDLIDYLEGLFEIMGSEREMKECGEAETVGEKIYRLMQGTQS